MTYFIRKTYGHDLGLSAAFRQWRADTHCNKLHGYALAITVEFECETLDARNWVLSFSQPDIKRLLSSLFDHKTLVAKDDPCIEWYRKGLQLGVIDLVELDAVGCECFAHEVFLTLTDWLRLANTPNGVRLAMVTVQEHGANLAGVRP